MSRIVIKGDKLLSILYKHFNVSAIRQKGSHVVVKDVNGRVTTVPVGRHELPQGTLNSILRDLRIEKESSQSIYDLKCSVE